MMDTFPTAPRPESVEFHLEVNAKAIVSPFDRSADVAEMAGDQWVASLSFTRLRRATADVRALLNFLSARRGPINNFFLWDHSRESPQGSALGAPLVNGASQTGLSIVTDGWTASENGLLLPGDLIEFGGELKEVTAQVDSDAFGDATIAFVPPIRVSPADDAAIATSSPKTLFRLATKDDGRPRHHGSLVDVQFTALEDF